MTEPVLVIHGVGNRSQQGFTDRVAALETAMSDQWHLVPVYWGDLAAHQELVAATVPKIVGIRDEPSVELQMLFGGAGGGDAGDQVRDSDAQIDSVLAGVRSQTGLALRDETPGELDPELVAALRSEWSTLDWLPKLTSADALEKVGALVAPAPGEPTTPADGPGAETRDGPQPIRLSMPDLGGFVRRRLQDVDALVGTVIRDTAGRANEYLRGRLGPGITEFFGDVLVYQRHRPDIHQRVRDTLAELKEPDLGSEKRPVFVAGHSLGGVIAFDIATLPSGQNPLWVKSLLTFGSQAPFFHVCDPRAGLAQYQKEQPVVLPPTLQRWTNLWESLDVVAFVAANVFRFHDGSVPHDIEVPHLASYGWWTHSVYWETDDLKNAFKSAFA